MGKITIYSQACNEIAGFRSMADEFTRKLVINGKSKSTYQNYLRQIAKLSLHYKRIPLELDVDQIEEYLFYLIQKDTDAQSSFKHLVYGLRKLFLLMDKEELQLALPCISRPEKLPVVLSAREVISLLKAPKHLSQKVMFGLIYDTGLRIDELTSLHIADVDLDRHQLHVRQSKYKKDRYITMSAHAVRGIKKHLALSGPKLYLFESSVRKGNPVSKSRIRALLKEAVEKAGIKKQVCVHTLRHTYATHQLEAGQNIMILKESMGHSDIQTTLVYLHIAQLDNVRKFGCMEKLYQKTGNA
jgi:integrase/recombinase XerD